MTNFFQLKNLQSCLESFITNAGTSFTLFHVNIRSIRKHWDEFQLVINPILSSADGFVLTEINIHNEDVCLFSLSGFKSTFFTRDKKCGGGIYSCFLKRRLIFFGGAVFGSLIGINRTTNTHFCL